MPPSTVELSPDSSIRVVKLGGSLLMLPDLAQRFEAWCSAENAKRQMHTLLMVGGGKIIDTVRELASVHTIEDTVIHHECIRLLSHTARLVQILFADFQLLSSTNELQQFLNLKVLGTTAIVDVAGVYSLIDEHAALPETWATTTDALAAGLAVAIQAEQLCLLKSAEPPHAVDKSLASADDHAKWFTQLAGAGYVDPAFPAIAAKVKSTRFVNFRSTAGTLPR